MKPKTQRQLFLVPVESCTATPRVWDMVWARRGRCLSWCVYFTFFIRYPGADWCRRPISRPCPPDFPTCNSSCDTLWKITVRFKKTTPPHTAQPPSTTPHRPCTALCGQILIQITRPRTYGIYASPREYILYCSALPLWGAMR